MRSLLLMAVLFVPLAVFADGSDPYPPCGRKVCPPVAFDGGAGSTNCDGKVCKP
jgi:hypothetical protein